ncbi:MAG: ZIP family metal transporter [Geminicoccaceae bacterium]|nr:ZIP family metal transporter [Geminicoccaceae bacterium]MCX8100197.1 ZIP family metal transporter [Geminicoccaceae bacterium]MDW8371357.1 ZIP family metal transporter [Geminicoccaceae bacterium]
METLWLGLVGSTLAGLLTGVGALPVLFTRQIRQRTQNLFLGFGAGVMLAATAFSLIVPGLDAARDLGLGRLPSALVVSAGILAGGLVLVRIGGWLAAHHLGSGLYAEDVAGRARVLLFILAITLHNFPEGLAVGVGFASGDVANGTALAVAIGLQNMPEGLAVAMAALAAGDTPRRAFLVGLISGVVEPVGGVLGAGLVFLAAPFLPVAMGFAAGAMLFVISEEVIPEINRERNGGLNSVGLLTGFVVMMMLDVVLA